MNVVASDSNREGARERVLSGELIRVLEPLLVEVVLNFVNTGVLTAADLYGGGGETSIVNNVIITHNAAKTLILRLVVGIMRKRGLEAASRPVSGRVCRLT